MSLPFGRPLLLAILVSIFVLSLWIFFLLRKTKKKQTQAKAAINPDIQEKTQIFPIQIVRISLKGKTNLREAEFNQITREFLQNKKFYLENYSPFFIVKDGKPIRYYPQTKPDNLLEKILLFWKEGFIFPEAALVLLFYREAFEKVRIISFLLQLLSLKNIPPKEKNLILFLYQKELNTNVGLDDIDFSISKRISFSYEHFWQNKSITRQIYRKLVAENILPEDEEFLSEIYSRATNTLCISLFKQGELHKKFQQLFFNQFLLSGKIHEKGAWLAGNYLPKLKIPENEEEFKDLLFELSQHTVFAKPLAYLILEKAQVLKKFRHLLTPESEELSLWEKQRGHISQSLQYAIFALLSENGFYKLALEFMPKKGNLKALLLKARTYYFNQQYQEALNIAENLLEKHPENFYVLNDAAIYYFRLGQQNKAEELFFKLKSYFPDHPAVLHNEALYFEQKTLKEIQEKWAALEQVEKSPVPA